MIITGYTVPDIWHVTDVIVIFHSGLLFALLLPQQPKKWKVKKNYNCIWRYYHFTQVYQKSSLYAILFLRYGKWSMLLLFFILGYFLLFYHPNCLKNKNFKKMKKKPPGDMINYTSVPKKIICYTVPDIWQVTYPIVIFHFGLLVALLPS